ncbi:Protein kinase-like domain [Penicillium camemberti]|uniref:non-specific serine/threonine protein kinase n=1 Tax=Penicillium camemberti (strain FM 013) TaxID=1429867 RepID=A0A0G4PN29_PENC3|nr:Protein kinase-like domain [Penicillium camemberti]
MGTSQENAEDARFIDILAHLPYACSAVERLAGGSVNCICRGSLVDPLPDGSRSVVIRQCSDVTRSTAELAFLQMAKDTGAFKPVLDNGVSVKPVHLYHFIPELQIQLVEDKVDSQLLKSFLLSPPSGPIIQDQIMSIGEAIGRWLACFHNWGRSLIEEQTLKIFRRNEDLHCKTPSPLYEAVANQCEDKVLRQAVIAALTKKDKRVQGVIHGDFSPRNILIQYSSLPVGTELTVIDWETITYENQLHDFANMMAVIYIQHHFSGAGSFSSLTQGFVRGYRDLDADLFAEALILIGVWMLFFRKIMAGPGLSEASQIDPKGKLKGLAIDFISKGANGYVGSAKDDLLEFLTSGA